MSVPRALRGWRGVLAAIVVLRIAAPLFVVIRIDPRFLFSPKPVSSPAWTAAPGRELLSFEPKRGSVVRGYDLTNPAARAYVIYFYGNSDQMYRDLPFTGWLRTSAACDVTEYDYEGSGYSGGTLTVPNVWRDALAEYDQVAARARAAGRPTIVYGYSLGSAVATYVAAHRRPGGVILHSPPYDVDREVDFVASRYAVWIALAGARASVTHDAREFFDNAGRVRSLREPLLVMHGTSDTFVPYGGGLALFAAAPSRDKRFVPLPGLDHTGWIPPTAGGRAVRAFVDRIARIAVARDGEHVAGRQPVVRAASDPRDAARRTHATGAP